MTDKPPVAMLVANLAQSIAFYVDLLAFTLGERPASDMVEIIDAEDDVMLLAGPQAGDVTPFLAQGHLILKPGNQVLFPSADLDSLYTKLLQAGQVLTPIMEKRWGDRMLELTDPDGYRVQFYTRAQRGPQESTALYAAGVNELDNALAGLAESDLDLSLEPVTWTIRHIVNHLADSETLFVWWMKLALSEPGRIYIQNWPTSNETTSILAHDKRDIAPSIALFKANRAHILQLIQHVDYPFERYTLDEYGHKMSFGELVALLIRHTMEHIDEIMEIRRVYGK